jgi:hypothetical protein
MIKGAKIYQNVVGLFIACLELNVWVKQYNELSEFCCLSLSDPTSWNEFQLAI